MEVIVIEDLAADPEVAWELVGDFAGLMRWHPHLAGCETRGEGASLIRTARFVDWWITERLDAHNPARKTMSYTIIASSNPEAVGAKATISLSSSQRGATRLRWHAHLPLWADEAQRTRLESYYRGRVDDLRYALGLRSSP